MRPRHAITMMLLSHVATFVVACALLPVEPTALELHQIVEREHGTVLDRARDSDLPGAVRALLLEKNMADVSDGERRMYAEERWLLRVFSTVLFGTALAVGVIVAVRRGIGRSVAHNDSTPPPLPCQDP